MPALIYKKTAITVENAKTLAKLVKFVKTDDVSFPVFLAKPSVLANALISKVTETTVVHAKINASLVKFALAENAKFLVSMARPTARALV